MKTGDYTSAIVRALAPQFDVANGAWYAADDADREWSIKSVGNDHLVIRSNGYGEKPDLEVTITVSKPQEVPEET